MMENIFDYVKIIYFWIIQKINDKFIMKVEMKNEIKNEQKKMIKIIDINNEIQIQKMQKKLEISIFLENEKLAHFNYLQVNKIVSINLDDMACVKINVIN